MKAFAPRFGVAWDPTGQGKTLLTASYGIFYEPYYTAKVDHAGAISAPPYLGTPQVSLPDFANHSTAILPLQGHSPLRSPT